MCNSINIRLWVSSLLNSRCLELCKHTLTHVIRIYEISFVNSVSLPCSSDYGKGAQWSCGLTLIHDKVLISLNLSFKPLN